MTRVERAEAGDSLLPWSAERPARWPVSPWRVRTLALAVLLMLLALLALSLSLAQRPALGIQWVVTADGGLALGPGTEEPRLQARIGQTVVALAPDDAALQPVGGLVLQRSARWLPEPLGREAWLAEQLALAGVDGARRLTLAYADGGRSVLDLQPLGIGGLGLIVPLLLGLVLMLHSLAVAVWLGRPSLANGLYALLAACLGGQLLFIAVGIASPLALPPAWARLELPVRSALDLLGAAALLHACLITPLRLPGARRLATLGWLTALGLLGLLLLRPPGAGWLGLQLGVGTLGALAVLAMGRGAARRHPYARLQRRLVMVLLGGWIVLSVTVAGSGPELIAGSVADVASTVWVILLAALLMLLPFLRDSQRVLREFSLIAGASTVAAALDLLFISLFPLRTSTSVGLAVFLGVGGYLGARALLLGLWQQRRRVDPERLFEAIYRMARQAQRDPALAPQLLTRLLRRVFEPLDASLHLDVLPEELPLRARVTESGAGLQVPLDLPRLGSDTDHSALVELRLAARGRRIFTAEDARLAQGMVEQLRRALAYDLAIEQGRHEERQRLAQDLHDDIGARLLTLMYQAGSPEREEYIRHTLQDLKTLTRGLAARGHRLGDAAAEWKADVQHRVDAAHIELHWQQRFDADPELGMAAWSALTRVLRELVSNTLGHARARGLWVEMALDAGVLHLSVADDGCGGPPQDWSHGLGLGGIRKRVRQMGGSVQWQQRPEGGIVCTAAFPLHAEAEAAQRSA